MSLQEQFQQIIEFRRSNRKFDPNVPVPAEVIERSLQRAILSPNSSNMQLWSFHWIHSASEKQKVAELCLGQSAARTAQELVVFVTRPDQWRARQNWHLSQVRKEINGEPTKAQKMMLQYYGKVMPLLYTADPLRVIAALRLTISFVGGLFKPFYRTGGASAVSIVTHKSCALAAQTFMLSVAAEGFHSCPLEGFDAKRLKKYLKLPYRAQINMVVAVGLGTEPGIWGERVRVSYEEVVEKI
ncbi:MAG: nitroreductase family protein [Sphingomonadales bacterium]